VPLVKQFHIHLISDSTGETVTSIARATLVQFDDIEITEHTWPLVRTRSQLDKVLVAVRRHPGPVIFSLINRELRAALLEECQRLAIPANDVLHPVFESLGRYFGTTETAARPGRQHKLDADYFDRIEAINYALSHDDGQGLERLEQADVVLLGVSRTSKTPTCMYLANRGIKAANIPLVPGVPLPAGFENLKNPLIVGLTKDPARLVDIRRSRLRMLQQEQSTDYIDPDAVRAEVQAARRLYSQHGWAVIDVTRRSIEETAAAIIQLLNDRDNSGNQPDRADRTQSTGSP
jgi:regulator of PEP synthase PpsR (kinase-PPPase family)